jgi:hypothetical protein
MFFIYFMKNIFTLWRIYLLYEEYRHQEQIEEWMTYIRCSSLQLVWCSSFQSRWLFFSMHRAAKAATIDGHNKTNPYCMISIAGREKTSCVHIRQEQDEMFQHAATPLDVQQNKEEVGSTRFSYKLFTLLSLPMALARITRIFCH